MPIFDRFKKLSKQDTKLSSEEQSSFDSHRKQFPKLDSDKENYDTQGLFKELYKTYNGDSEKIKEELSKDHGTDRYKKSNHPTFSNQSKYSNFTRKGGKWDHDESGDFFIARPRNIRNMIESDGTPENYMNRAEDTDGDGKSNVKLKFKNRKAARLNTAAKYKPELSSIDYDY